MENALQQIDDEMIDTLTGEIMQAATTPETALKITVEDLPKICRVLRAMECRQAMVEQYMKDEVQRITETCNHKIQALSAEHSYMMGLAEGLLRQAGKTKLQYPGLGTVRIGHTRESIDTSCYDELSLDDQSEAQRIFPSIFRTTVKVAPDKKEIKRQMDNGDCWYTQDNKKYFTIRPKQEQFQFKAE